MDLAYLFRPLRSALANVMLLACADAVLAQSVTPRQILIGQNITLQGGKTHTASLWWMA